MKGIIIYTSRYGSTEKAAKLLQSKFTEGIKAVNIAREKAPGLSSFDMVIIGGPIYAGKTLKALTAYMRGNLEELKTKRLGLFVCAGEQDPSLSEKQMMSAFPEELYNRAVIKESFGGELYWEKLDPVTKFILKVVKGIKEGFSRLSQTKIEGFAREMISRQAKITKTA